MTTTKFKGLTFCTFAAVFAAGQAFAHTGVRDVGDEGKASYNGFTITHGCGAGETGSESYPVIGQAALFPFGNFVVWKDASGAVIQEGGNGNGTISSATLNLSVTGYAGTSPFFTTQEIVDGAGNVRALLWKDGAMEPKLNAITAFKVTLPTIADNCVKSLKIRLGVINYCDVGKNADNDIKGPYKAPKDAFGRKIPHTSVVGGTQANVSAKTFSSISKGNGDNNRADWWFTAPYGGSALYSDPDVLQPTFWTTLTVNNNAEDIKKCAGTPVDVTVEPTGVAFDTYLTANNTRPFSSGPSNL
jgi:hypothetical protein